MNKYIGVIGGTGKIGQKIIEYLSISNKDIKILVGSRNPQVLQQNIQNKDFIRFKYVNYLSYDSLKSYCQECSIIINAAGPSALILDHIAKVALEFHCHYIDIGGYGKLYNCLIPLKAEIQKKGLVFILGAGWMPGLSGLLPISTIENARQRNIQNLELTVFYGAVDAWGYGSSYDLAESSSQNAAFYYKLKERIKSNILRESFKEYIDTIGKHKICYPLFDEQLIQCAEKYDLDSFKMFVLLNDWQSIFNYLRLFFYRKQKEKSAQILQKDSLRLWRKEGAWGTIICQARGFKDGKIISFQDSITTSDNILCSGIPAVIATNWILNQQIISDVNYLCYMVNAGTFLKDVIRNFPKIILKSQSEKKQ